MSPKQNKKGTSTTKDKVLTWNNFYSKTNFGLGIQCTKCEKWRKVFEYEEAHEVPEDWECKMSIIGGKKGNCRIPSELKEDDFAAEKFVPGTLVWARERGFPWWPGMIEDDPDLREYYDAEDNSYNVTFLGEKVSRAWVPESSITLFVNPPKMSQVKKSMEKKFKKSESMAKNAVQMSLSDRLKKFSFVLLYKGKFPQVQDTESDVPDDFDKKGNTEVKCNLGRKIIPKVSGSPNPKKRGFETIADLSSSVPKSRKIERRTESDEAGPVNSVEKSNGGSSEEESDFNQGKVWKPWTKVKIDQSQKSNIRALETDSEKVWEPWTKIKIDQSQKSNRCTLESDSEEPSTSDQSSNSRKSESAGLTANVDISSESESDGGEPFTSGQTQLESVENHRVVESVKAEPTANGDYSSETELESDQVSDDECNESSDEDVFKQNFEDFMRNKFDPNRPVIMSPYVSDESSSDESLPTPALLKEKDNTTTVEREIITEKFIGDVGEVRDVPGYTSLKHEYKILKFAR